jgi:plastocyanin
MLAHRTLRLALALALPFALTACGSTQRIKPTSKATPVPVGSIAPTVNPKPTTPPPPSESATAAPTGGATSAPPAGGNDVKALVSNKFDPDSLSVKAGTKVTWTAEGFHSVTSGTPDKPDASGPMNAQVGFTTYSVTFDKPGTYKYFCQPHGSLGMVGEIVVT